MSMGRESKKLRRHMLLVLESTLLALVLIYISWICITNFPDDSTEVEYWDAVELFGVTVWHSGKRTQAKLLLDGQGNRLHTLNNKTFRTPIPDGWVFNWYRNGSLSQRAFYREAECVLREQWSERGSIVEREVFGSNGYYCTWYESGAPRSYEPRTFGMASGDKLKWTETGVVLATED